MRKLDKRVRKVWAVSYAIVFLVLVLGSAVYELARLVSGNQPPGFPGMLTGLLLLLGLLAVFVLPGIRYRFWAFELTDEELRLLRGVITRVYTVVPLRRIQHLDISQNIIEREIDLGKLIVYTAGTQGNRVVLPGLPIEEARELRDRIKAFILEDAV